MNYKTHNDRMQNGTLMSANELSKDKLRRVL
jgi:hypothetical protein